MTMLIYRPNLNTKSLLKLFAYIAFCPLSKPIKTLEKQTEKKQKQKQKQNKNKNKNKNLSLSSTDFFIKLFLLANHLENYLLILHNHPRPDK